MRGGEVKVRDQVRWRGEGSGEVKDQVRWGEVKVRDQR